MTHTSYTLPCQISVCQTALLLISVTHQKNEIVGKVQPLLLYHQHLSLVVGKNNKIGGTTFGAAAHRLLFCDLLEGLRTS